MANIDIVYDDSALTFVTGWQLHFLGDLSTSHVEKSNL